MRLMLALVGVILLISGGVIGASAGQQPILDMSDTAVTTTEELPAEIEVIETSPEVVLPDEEQLNAGLIEALQAAEFETAVAEIESAVVEDESEGIQTTDELIDEVQILLDEAQALQADADPVAQDPPPEDEPAEDESEARQTANALLASIEALFAKMAAEEEPVAEEPVEPPATDLEEGYPDDVVPEEGEDEDQVEEIEVPETNEELSPAQQLAAQLLEKARALFDSLSGEEAEEEVAEPVEQTLIAEAEESEGLFDQLKSLVEQITGLEFGAQDESVQTWMPSKPDCDADPAPGVNWENCDMSGIELAAADLRGANLMGTDFSGASISDTDFSGAHMGEASFADAELDNVIMRESIMTGADFSEALLLFVDMSFSDASEADFSETEIYVVLANSSKFIGADFSGSIILFANFDESDLSKALFVDSLIGFGSFREATFKEADLSSAVLQIVDMTGADLSDLDLSEITMQNVLFKIASGEPTSSADLSAKWIICPDGTAVTSAVTTDAASLCTWDGATITAMATAEANVVDPCSVPAAPGVDWSGCDKSGINIKNKDLRGAILVGTDFTGTTFKRTDLSGADMTDAIFTGADLLLTDLSDSTLRGATFENAKMNAVTFAGADLSGANLEGTAIITASFRQGDLFDVGLGGSNMTFVDFSFADMDSAGSDGLTLLGIFMNGANLTEAIINASSLYYVDMSSAQIEEFDMSGEFLEDAIWLKKAMGTPTSSEDVTLNGTLICPAGDAVFGQLVTPAAELCTWQPCWQGIEDGSFEGMSDAWMLPATEHTAAYSQEQAHSPDWSVRTGIIEPDPNRFSFSSVSQKVVLPAGAENAILSFWLYPQTDEPTNMIIPTSIEQAMMAKDVNFARGGPGSDIGDAQWVMIFDVHGNELLRPISMRSNSRTWEYYEFDISELAGEMSDRTVVVYFGSFNNGHAGRTGMYVDDVQLTNCPGSPPPPPPEPPPQVCSDIVENGGFETMDTWILPLTPHPADYSDEQYNMGSYSMRTGLSSDEDKNVESFSSAVQKVTIPHDATEATLKFYLRPQSDEATDLLIPESMEAVMAPGAMDMKYGDAQWVLILNKHGQQLDRLVSMRSDAQTWSEYEFNLLPYKGHKILLYFSSYNNGWDGRTAMYVDDVSLEVCAPEVDDVVVVPDGDDNVVTVPALEENSE